jgi:diacylglycerol kinase family enzyme
MTDPEDKIHVIPLGSDWEIEAQSGAPITHEEKKGDAIAVACEIAREEGIQTVIVHDGDGVTEAVHPAAVEKFQESEALNGHHAN